MRAFINLQFTGEIAGFAPRQKNASDDLLLRVYDWLAENAEEHLNRALLLIVSEAGALELIGNAPLDQVSVLIGKKIGHGEVIVMLHDARPQPATETE